MQGTVTPSASSPAPTSSPATCCGRTPAITSYSRVVFPGADEIEFMTGATSAPFPEAPYRALRKTLQRGPMVLGRRARRFPEEFAAFLLGSAKVREAFLDTTRDLLTPSSGRPHRRNPRRKRRRLLPIRSNCASATPSSGLVHRRRPALKRPVFSRAIADVGFLQRDAETAERKPITSAWFSL